MHYAVDTVLGKPIAPFWMNHILWAHTSPQRLYNLNLQIASIAVSKPQDPVFDPDLRLLSILSEFTFSPCPSVGRRGGGGGSLVFSNFPKKHSGRSIVYTTFSLGVTESVKLSLYYVMIWTSALS